MTPNPDPDGQSAAAKAAVEEEVESVEVARALTKREQIELDIGPKYKYIHDIGAGAFGKVVKVERIRTAEEEKKESNGTSSGSGSGSVSQCQSAVGGSSASKGKNKKSDFFAVKIVGNIFSSKAKAKRFLREVRTLRLLSSHESIVELVDIVIPPKPATFTKLSVVFEAMPTDLKRIFRSKQYLSALHIEYILYQILLGLQFVHSAGVVHRDLKPENIIIDEECTIRIIDFGLARGVKENLELKEEDIRLNAESKFLLGMQPDPEPEADAQGQGQGPSQGDDPLNDAVDDGVDDEKNGDSEKGGLSSAEKKAKLLKANKLTKHVVTRWYRSPEVILLQQERDYVYGVDVWSIGCIFAELLQMHQKNQSDYKQRRVLFPGRTCFPFSTKDPFDYQHRTDQLRVVFNLIGTPQQSEIERFKDKNVQIYLNNMTPSKPVPLSDRFPATNGHGIKLLTEMLRFDVTKRITVEQALKSPFFENVRDEAAEIRAQKIESFEFEDIDIELDKLRALILEEIMYFNPEWKKQLKAQLKHKQDLLLQMQSGGK